MIPGVAGGVNAGVLVRYVRSASTLIAAALPSLAVNVVHLMRHSGIGCTT